MAVTLGKRKRRADVKPESSSRRDSDSSADEATARELFQRAFEAKFKPLEKVANIVDEAKDDDDSSDEDDEAGSDWSGLTEDEEDDHVEVVEHSKADYNHIDDIFSGKKAFMSSKPPALDDQARTLQKPVTAKDPANEDGNDATNVKNDLALQRLLKESHLLDPSSFSSSSPAPDSKGRLKALDLRLQDLGAKTSILKQEKMPLSHRKGITAKSTSREANRRKEAAENGVILEKVRMAPKSQQKRERGIAGPGVGKFRGGTLKLSSRDIASVKSSGSRSSGGKGRKR